MIVERPTVERRVLDSLEASRIPVILGGDGTGRTSLLLRLADHVGGPGQYLDLAAAASTPERCFMSIQSALRGAPPPPATPASPREAFDALMGLFDDASSNGRSATFLIDEFLELQTFDSFPGLRHVQREAMTLLAASRSQFVLASRFTTRVHRLLRDAPSRFEVIHLSPMEAHEIEATAMRFDHAVHEAKAPLARAVAALSAGLADPAVLMLEAMSPFGPAADPVAAMVGLFAPEGRLTARCRQTYERRLSHARGYGALKAILGILAEEELLNLTEIAQRMHRTPGSTKDYLSWLEDVDLIVAQRKRYAFDDPLLRLYLRLYGRPVPPTDADIVREVTAYAEERLPRVAAEPPAEPALATSASGDRAREPRAADSSGIIEID
jgi:hypothetical protein